MSCSEIVSEHRAKLTSYSEIRRELWSVDLKGLRILSA